jgi:hypothetical protein
MNSRELVRSTIEFRRPTRLAIEDLSNFELSDIVGIGFEPSIWKWKKIGGGLEECTDLFGCLRRRKDTGIGEIHKEALSSWDELDNYKLPDMNALEKVSQLQLQQLPAEKYVMGDIGQFMQKIFEIRGFENALLDFGLYPDKVNLLVDKLTNFAVERTKMYAKLGGIDCISIYDDWGTQQSLLISPNQWRKLFLDSYKRLFAAAHENNMHVYFHCCGAVDAIVGDLIEAGVNIINFDQPRLHGIEYLGDTYGGKVTFCCPVDIQKTLPAYDKNLIHEEVLELVNHLHKNGGFIAKIYHSWAETQPFDAAEYSREIFETVKI